MTTAWIFVFWGQWQYYLVFRSDKMIMKTKLAAITSVVVFLLLVLISSDCISGIEGRHKALSKLIAALGLLVGISWEKAFDFALSEVLVGHDDSFTFWGYIANVVACAVLPDLIVGPAWAAFI